MERLIPKKTIKFALYRACKFGFDSSSKLPGELLLLDKN